MGCGHGASPTKPRLDPKRPLEVQCPFTRPRSEQNRSLGVLTSPAFGECRHRGLARRLVAVRRRAILMMPIRHEQRRWPAFTKGAGDAIKLRSSGNSGRRPPRIELRAQPSRPRCREGCGDVLGALPQPPEPFPHPTLYQMREPFSGRQPKLNAQQSAILRP